MVVGERSDQIQVQARPVNGAALHNGRAEEPLTLLRHQVVRDCLAITIYVSLILWILVNNFPSELWESFEHRANIKSGITLV